jgi:hypothetical protein
MSGLRLPRIGSALLPLAILLFQGQAASVAPAGYYSLTANTALDTRTQLLWMRGWLGIETWTDAAQGCQALTLDGFTGWRLPTARELESIYDPRVSDANMWDGTVFQLPLSIAGATVWSSTEVAGDPTTIEARHFLVRGFQQTNRVPLDKSDYAGVKCVRDP